VTTIALFVAAIRMAKRFSWPNELQWQDLGLVPIAIGSAAGMYSHIVLDSIMHTDIAPFAPFSTANPLLGTIRLGSLHLFCLVAGAFGMLVVLVRWLWESRAKTPSNADGA
jgi:membrane-bound metal-dependent hydrolase YbcI (DUF457 family)